MCRHTFGVAAVAAVAAPAVPELTLLPLHFLALAQVREARRRMHEGAAAGAIPDAITLAKMTGMEEGPVKGVLPIHGNETTYNLETMLFENIKASEYFADLA